MGNLWFSVKAKIKELLPDPIYRAWFENLEGRIDNDNNLILEVPNEFTKTWLEENYKNLMEQILKEFKLKAYVFIIKELCKPEQLVIPYNPVCIIGRKLSSKYTFEDFVVGKCNELAYNVCYQVTEETPKGYLIYLYGSFGLGKTHLTQAVGNRLFKKGFHKVYYLTAQDFLSYLMKYLKSGMIETFKENFKEHCEILLLEGIHFFAGKEYTQNELIFLLDYLLDQGKTIIFTSYKLPQEITDIDNSLKSRLNSSLLIKLGMPDFNTRKKIIKYKAKKLGYNLDYEIVEYLARKIRGDVRQLESVVLGLIARASLLKEPISLALAKELVEELGIKDENENYIDIVIETICKFIGTDRSILFSSSRKKEATFSRQLIIYILRNVLKKSLKEIASLLRKQHSTIIYNLKTFEEKLKNDTTLRMKLNYLIREITLELNDRCPTKTTEVLDEALF